MSNDAAVNFFFENAGWSYDPKKETSDQGKLRCAQALAHAEAEARKRGWSVCWDYDPEPYQRGDAEERVPDEVFVAILYDENTIPRASLGGIGDPTPEYRRVIAAELAHEALLEEKDPRESRSALSPNDFTDPEKACAKPIIAAIGRWFEAHGAAAHDCGCDFDAINSEAYPTAQCCPIADAVRRADLALGGP